MLRDLEAEQADRAEEVHEDVEGGSHGARMRRV
jgi:hypothetical protein